MHGLILCCDGFRYRLVYVVNCQSGLQPESYQTLAVHNDYLYFAVHYTYFISARTYELYYVTLEAVYFHSALLEWLISLNALL